VAVYFFDSSGIVKRYLQETGTSWVMERANPASGDRIYLARIAGVEVISALARQRHNGSLSAEAAAMAAAQFRYDFAHQYRIIEIAPALVEGAMELAERHALRGYDAVQLSAALEVQRFIHLLGMPALCLVSADAALNEAARTEGLSVEDPNTRTG
jgi:predicted nucleic acid-binding protein